MVGADKLARQVQRYGMILSNALVTDPEYDPTLCDECAHDHCCCNLLVTVTPYEALGIMSWIKEHIADWTTLLGLVKMRAEALRAFIADKDGKPYFKSEEEMATAWVGRGFKCVFYGSTAYEGSGGCSIYPVRPVNCRKVYGKGDCGDEKASGVATMAEDPQLYETRANRATVRQLEQIGAPKSQELCSLITLLRNPDVLITSEDPKIMNSEPELLTDDQVLWGFVARPMENPWSEA